MKLIDPATTAAISESGTWTRIRAMCDSNDLQNLLDAFFSEEACSWCGDRGRKLHGKPLRLCGSCQGINRLIRYWERMEKEDPLGPDQLAIAKRMRKLAQEEAARFEDINKRQIDGVDLENAFTEVARIAVHRELPYNDASVFEQSFTLSQRRFLFYLLASLIRIDNRRHRKFTAGYGTD